MWWVLAALAVYAAIGFAWGSFLNSIAAPAGNVVQGRAVLHGAFWPVSLFWLAT